MPKGGHRPGSGRQAKSLEELRLAGTFRPDRHARLLTMPLPKEPASWEPDEAQLAGLDNVARAFVDRLIAANEMDSREGAILIELGHVASALAAVRAVKREGLSLDDLRARDRLEQGWLKLFASLISQLRVKP